MTAAERDEGWKHSVLVEEADRPKLKETAALWSEQLINRYLKENAEGQKRIGTRISWSVILTACALVVAIASFINDRGVFTNPPLPGPRLEVQRIIDYGSGLTVRELLDANPKNPPRVGSAMAVRLSQSQGMHFDLTFRIDPTARAQLLKNLDEPIVPHEPGTLHLVTLRTREALRPGQIAELTKALERFAGSAVLSLGEHAVWEDQGYRFESFQSRDGGVAGGSSESFDDAARSLLNRLGEVVDDSDWALSGRSFAVVGQ